MAFAARLLSTRTTVRTRNTSTVASLREILRTELDGIRAAGTWKSERVITSPQAASIRVKGRSGELLNFCANNYLGLSVKLSMLPPSAHFPFWQCIYKWMSY